LSARWYEGAAGLQQLESDWLELAAEADLFARYEWHLAAALHLVGDGDKIWFCRIGDDAGRPAAIIPAVTGLSVRLQRLAGKFDSRRPNFRWFKKTGSLTRARHERSPWYKLPRNPVDKTDNWGGLATT
jgi:hypothetical protein